MTWRQAMDGVPMLLLLACIGSIGWVVLASMGQLGWPWLLIAMLPTAMAVAFGLVIVQTMVEDWRK